MRKVLFLVGLLIMAVVTFAQETKKVAILEVVDREGKMSYGQKLMLRSNLAKAVTNTAGYEAYDRSDVDAIMSEQDFQRTGMVSEAEIQKLGEMTGVSYILVSEGALAGDGQIYVAVKLLDVETAKVVMTENKLMGESPIEMQNGCEALANKLFSGGAAPKNNSAQKQVASNKESSSKPAAQTAAAPQKSTQQQKNLAAITRVNNKEYTYMGSTMDKKAYAEFLMFNCPQASKQFELGKKLSLAGWGCLGGGIALAVAGGVLVGVNGVTKTSTSSNGGTTTSTYSFNGTGLMLLVPGCLATVGGAVLVPLGYAKQKKSVDIYNNNCATNKLTFNLTAGSNGIGVAMQF